MALFGQDAPDPRVMAMGQVLGDIVTGGPQARGKEAYVDQLRKNGQAADALWGARKARAVAIANEAAQRGETIQALMGTDEVARAQSMANLGLAGVNIRNLGDYARPDYVTNERARQAAVLGGDSVNAARYRSAAEGTDYKPVTVNAQGVAYDQYAPLGEIAFKTTPIADAAIADKARRADAYVLGQQAGAAQRYAAAGASKARAGVYNAQAAAGGFNPNSGGQARANAAVKAINADRAANGEPPLTKAEETQVLTAVAAGRDFTIPLSNSRNPTKAGVSPNTDNGVGTPSVLGESAPAARVRAKAARAWSQSEVQQAISEARSLVASKRITPAEAAARLRSAGLHNAAGLFE